MARQSRRPRLAAYKYGSGSGSRGQNERVKERQQMDEENKYTVTILNFSVYVLDGYDRMGFISRWGKCEMETTLDFDRRKAFSVDELPEVCRVLDYHGIRHSVVAYPRILKQ